jgi:hypothetical protein
LLRNAAIISKSMACSFYSEPLDTVGDRKHEAIEVEDVFRLNGAVRRIKRLQTLFEKTGYGQRPG